MTAPTIAPQETAHRAHLVLHDVMPVLQATISLDEALDTYRALAGGTVHWSAVYEELAGEPEPEYAALVKAADDADGARQHLIRTIAIAAQTLTGATS